MADPRGFLKVRQRETQQRRPRQVEPRDPVGGQKPGQLRLFQLTLGDTLKLRLPAAGSNGASHTVPFHFAGIVNEFPTAPKDSFFVANAGYVAARTGNPSVGEFLVNTDGTSPPVVGARIAAIRMRAR